MSRISGDDGAEAGALLCDIVGLYLEQHMHSSPTASGAGGGGGGVGATTMSVFDVLVSSRILAVLVKIWVGWAGAALSEGGGGGQGSSLPLAAK